MRKLDIYAQRGPVGDEYTVKLGELKFTPAKTIIIGRRIDYLTMTCKLPGNLTRQQKREWLLAVERSIELWLSWSWRAYASCAGRKVRVQLFSAEDYPY